MIATSKYKGHEIKCINEEWFFVSTGEPVKEVYKKICCGHCGSKQTKEGHDGCLGTLPGVMNACCGHGEVNEAYIQYTNKKIIRGSLAVNAFSKLKVDDE